MQKPTKDIFFVSIQALLFVAYLWKPNLVILPDWPELWLSGILLSLLGSGILFKSLVDLNVNLSPFPSPKKSAQLVTSGIYKSIRHPIYSGIILFALGYGLISESGYRLLIALMLLILFHFKSKYEEKLLERQYPSYPEYKESTGAFVPQLKIRR